MLFRSSFEVFGFYDFSKFGFYPQNFESIWILPLKIQILKLQDVKSKHPQTSLGKIQILKLLVVKSKYSQTLGCVCLNVK